MKPTDLRGILEYIPQFREKTFVLAIDVHHRASNVGMQLPEWIRIFIGTQKENERCLAALKSGL